MWRGSPEGTNRAYKYLGSLRLWRYMFTRKRMEGILSVVMFNKWQVIQQPNWSKTNTCTYQSGIIVSQLVHSALLPRESFGECLQTTRYNQFSVTRPLLGPVVLVCLREVFTLRRSSTPARKGEPKGWENLVIYPSEKFWKSRDRPFVRPWGKQPKWKLTLSSWYCTSRLGSIDGCQKTGYPLTSMTCSYHGLRRRPIEVKSFFGDIRCQVTIYQLIVGSTQAQRNAMVTSLLSEVNYTFQRQLRL